MTRTKRILNALPATVCEIAAIEKITVKNANAVLCNLRKQFLATRTDRHGQRYSQRGPKPALWEKIKLKEKNNG